MINANISLHKFILLVYIFALNLWSYSEIQKETNLSSDEESESDDEGESWVLSSNTRNKYLTLFRNMIGKEMLHIGGNMIGFPWQTVELDESIIGKSEHN